MDTFNGYEFSILFPRSRQLTIGIIDLMKAPVEAIVNPSNNGLASHNPITSSIYDTAGYRLRYECENIIRVIASIPITLAVSTGAGALPFVGIIHAVSPCTIGGECDCKSIRALEKTITNSLLAAEKKGWESIAFPGLCTGTKNISKRVCARAFKQAIHEYWHEDYTGSIKRIWLCLSIEEFGFFQDLFIDNREDHHQTVALSN